MREETSVARSAGPHLLVVCLTWIVGSCALGALLRVDRDASWFPLAALGVAAIWTVGALAAGGPWRAELRWPKRITTVQPLVVGVVLAAIFCVGALLTRAIPPLVDLGNDVLSFAGAGSGVAVTAATALSGFAEEFFFRGALRDSLPRHRALLSTLAYGAATAFSGNPLLTFAALILGGVTAWQRERGTSILGVGVTHVTWTLTMMYLLPLLW